jgi:hypothetical protein
MSTSHGPNKQEPRCRRIGGSLQIISVVDADSRQDNGKIPGAAIRVNRVMFGERTRLHAPHPIPIPPRVVQSALGGISLDFS